MKLRKLRVLSAALAVSMILDMTGINVLAQEANLNTVEEQQTAENGTQGDDVNGGTDNDGAGDGEESGKDEETGDVEESGKDEETGDGEESGKDEETGDGEEPGKDEETGDGEESGKDEETGDGEETGADEKTDDEEESENTEESISGNSVSENDIEKTEEENDDFAMFPGMGSDYKLTSAQMADKAELAKHLGDGVPEDDGTGTYADANGIYEQGEVVYLTDSQEEAEQVAEAFGGTLDSYSYGVAVVNLAEGVTVARAVAAAASAETNLPAVWPNYYYHLLDEETPENADDDIEEYVGEDSQYYLAASVANDPALVETSANYQWMHDYVGDSYAWTAGYKGQGIKVAVIDTGLLTTHEDLAANALAGKDFSNSANGTDHPDDNQEHGTHVAGIIAAEENNGKGGAGIAPDAKVSGYCVFSTSGGATEADIVRAINAAVANGYDIINMSLGGYFYSKNQADAVKMAYEAGVAVFAAAGNEATNANSFPAAYPGVISVGAVDKTGAKASFSNYGSTVDVSFPGVAIYSTTPGSTSSYESWDGTSMACPAAAGTAAVILSARSDIRSKSGKQKVDALLAAMKKSTTKSSSGGMGAGTTYLPGVLGLATTQTAPAAPTIEIQGSYDSSKKYYRNQSVTATISTTTPVGVAIYYSTDGKKPSYKNGVVTNGRLLTATPTGNTKYSGTVTLTGAKKVTVNAIAVNTITGKVSKMATKAVTLAPTPTAVSVTQANGITKIAAGKSVALSAAVTPTYAVSTKVKWSIDAAASKAGVKVSNGKVTTTSKTPAGTYTITATAVGSDGKTYDGKSGSYQLTVLDKAYISKVTLKPNKLTLDLVKNKTFGLPSYLVVDKTDKTKGDSKDVVWSSSNAKIAKVDANGAVTAVAAGKATITATANDGSGKKATCAVTVTSPVTKITVSGPAKVAAGKTIILTASVAPATATKKKVTWTVTGNDKVKVNGGKVTAAKDATGTCTIQAQAADGSGIKSNAYSVTIVSGAITGIKLDNTKMTLFSTKGNSSAKTSGTLKATVAGTTGVDTSAVTFTSSAPGIVAVSQSGTTATLTAKSAGKAVITCAAADGSGKKATCTVTVNVPMSKIMVTPTNGYNGVVAQSKSINLVAKYNSNFGTPTNKNVSWSSNSQYVTVNKGKVTAKKDAPVGTKAVITATAADGSGVRGSYTVTVTPLMKKVYIDANNRNLKTASDQVVGVTGELWVIGEDKDGNVYNMGDPDYMFDYVDTQVSGGANAGCNVVTYSNGYCIVRPVPGKETVKGSLVYTNRLYVNNLVKMTVTVTLKDGSNAKAKFTGYFARDIYGNTKIFG